MLQQTPRTSDIDSGEWSHLVTDAGDMAARAHLIGSRGPHGGHASPLAACGVLCPAHSRPVHPYNPFTMALLSGVGIHCFMLSCCTFEDVEIVNVVGPRPKLVQCTRNHKRYNFTRGPTSAEQVRDREAVPAESLRCRRPNPVRIYVTWAQQYTFVA